MHVSSRNTEYRWPVNFPDISPPNFLLWGHLKGLSHKRSLQNPNAFEEVSGSCSTSRIRRHVRKNNQDPPAASRSEFRKKGRHVEYVLPRLRNGNDIVQTPVE